MSPAVAAARFLSGFLMGVGMGAVYGFLRPLRNKRKNLADFLFLLVLLPGVVYFTFAICRGAPQLALLVAPISGGVLWELSLGRLFRPVWSAFWVFVWAVHWHIRKFFEKTWKIAKKLFASGKKSSTI